MSDCVTVSSQAASEARLPRLPVDLMVYQDHIAEQLRPAAFLRGKRPADAGSTRLLGVPDIPVDGPGARLVGIDHYQSPLDGLTGFLQLNLADIPDAVRRDYWPKAGVAWVLIDLSEETGWTGEVLFDPRPAGEIRWTKRDPKLQPTTGVFEVRDTLPLADPDLLPMLCWDRGLEEEYNDWRHRYFRPAEICLQVGGWICPIQGDPNEADKSMVAAIDRQSFGDNGAVYLHYDRQGRWHVEIHTH